MIVPSIIFPSVFNFIFIILTNTANNDWVGFQNDISQITSHKMAKILVSYGGIKGNKKSEDYQLIFLL